MLFFPLLVDFWTNRYAHIFVTRGSCYVVTYANWR